MSFSHTVKAELSQVSVSARHCQLAELAAIISMAGKVTFEAGSCSIRVASENVYVTQRFSHLVKKAFAYDTEVSYNNHSSGKAYAVYVRESDMAVKILRAAKLLKDDPLSCRSDMGLVSLSGINQLCCKRAFLRGCFLAGGSISDPEKAYHLEIVAGSKEKAALLVETAGYFELEAKSVQRRGLYVFYIKEGAQIVDMLNVMGAHNCLMELESIRVVKEVRNSVNRKVNCETANLNKTVNAAVKQIEDIRYINETIGLDKLPEGLEEIASVRLANPDMPLKDLGERLSSPLGKSGVNHRLRKISQIADDLRDGLLIL